MEIQERRDGPVEMARVPVESAALAKRARSSSVFSSMVCAATDAAETGEGGTTTMFELEFTSMIRIGGGGGGRLGMYDFRRAGSSISTLGLETGLRSDCRTPVSTDVNLEA